MIDTINLIYRFPKLENYNECYMLIDNFANVESNGTKRLHRKDKEISRYVTTAFVKYGFLEIAFRKNKKHNDYTINLFIKPVVLTCGTDEFNLSLADEDDYDTMEREFNDFMENINDKSTIPNLLPPLCLWSVNRVDYAYDIEDAYTENYIRLFQHGKVPANFTYHHHDTSFYLTSKECNINFYNKIRQLQDRDIEYEHEVYRKTGDYGMCGESILRLEVQCKTRKLSHIKEDFNLSDRTLKSFWSEKIAYTVLKNYVKKIIGKEDVFTYDKCVEMLQKKYPRGNKTIFCCRQIILSLKEHPELSVDYIYSCHPHECKKYLHKIRAAGINPIPLEAISAGSEKLSNPYKELEMALEMSDL